MTFSDLLSKFDLALGLDIFLILICGLSCLYCIRLSARLSKLNNLKTGVGASILSLTEAIEQTHAATQESQTTTVQTIETLRHLIDSAEKKILEMEAKQIDLDRNIATTRALKKHLRQTIDEDLPHSIQKAVRTAQALKTITKDVKAFGVTVDKPDLNAEVEASAAIDNFAFFYPDMKTEPAPSDTNLREGSKDEKMDSSPLKLVGSK